MQDQRKNLKVASPCHVGWESMSGNDRVRFCESCQLNVYNLSEMTSDEVRSLIVKSEGRLCGRMYRRADGSILTRDCPVGLRAVRLRVAKFASAVFATMFSVCSISFSQTKTDDKQSPKTSNYKIEVTARESSGCLTGKLLDTAGASIARAEVTLRSPRLTETKVNSDDNGEFTFGGLIDGHYSLSVSSPGFVDLQVPDISINANQAYRATITLDVGEIIMGGIVTGMPLENIPKLKDVDQLLKRPIKNPQ